MSNIAAETDLIIPVDSISQIDQDKKLANSKLFYAECASMCAINMFLLVVLGTNICGLIVGIHYTDAKCYIYQTTLSLAMWLTLVSSTIICSFAIFLFCAIVLTRSATLTVYTIISSMPFLIFSVCMIIFVIGTNICGIIELAYQYDKCIDQVSAVCYAVIVLIIINTLSILCMARIMVVNAICKTHMYQSL